jgi:hypothetical protein
MRVGTAAYVCAGAVNESRSITSNPVMSHNWIDAIA